MKINGISSLAGIAPDILILRLGMVFVPSSLSGKVDQITEVLHWAVLDRLCDPADELCVATFSQIQALCCAFR